MSILIMVIRMKTNSIWTNLNTQNETTPLNNDIFVDVLIIGGGITGLSTAYHLKDSNLKVCLVEKKLIGSGVTSKTTGKLTYLQENIYNKLFKYHGLNKTKLYLNSQITAINLVKNIILSNNIDCNLEKVDSYLVTNNNPKELLKEVKLLKKLNVSINQATNLPTKKYYKKCYYVSDTYVFHPLKYLQSLKNICLKNNISIYEYTKIISVHKKENIYVCRTPNNTIKAKYIIFATHYPYFIFPFLMPLKTSIEKSYIAAYPVNKNYKFSSITINKPTISERYYTNNDLNYHIYLTNSHNTSIKDNDLNNFHKLLNNKIKPDYIWSNKDIITNDLLPFIGAIDKSKTLLIGTGYNTWGMTNGSLAGKILADNILHKKNIYSELFNPLRKINIGKIINTPIILVSSLYSFTKSKIKKTKPWYPQNVKFAKKSGKNVAIYTDENNQEHIVYNLCPHLKCSLLFNEIEKTWDCPCHGSRFDIDGNCLEGPSNYSIKYKE